MKKVLTLFLLLCFTSLVISAQDEETDTLPGLTLVSVQSAIEILDSLPRHATLSPDGNLLAYETGNNLGLCIYNFTEETIACTPYAETEASGEEARLRRPTELKWSPDSRFVTLTENSLIYLEDSDIWLYDVENGEYINKTNDNYAGGIFISEESRGIPVDVLPTWSPEGSLYFFRYVRYEDVDTTELYTMLAVGDAPELPDKDPQLVADFSANVPMPFTFYNTTGGFSLSGAAEISPDGTQMAVIMRPQDPTNYELWIVNLIDGSITQRIPTLGISAMGLPDWVENQGFVPEGVTWLNDNALVLNFVNYIYTTGVNWTAYHINLETDDITPIFDFASVPSQADYYTGTETESGFVDYPTPRFGAVTPNGEYLLYITTPNSPLGATLEALPVNGGERLILHRIGEDFEVIPSLFASIGTDGDIVRAMLSGYIFTFEVVE